ncbi:MAG: hypothetical protein PVG22_11950 [Chromatiales bacterium]|jgi:hypothetical protein
MKKDSPRPGISRQQRLSEEGLLRLEHHLQLGTTMSEQILAQWIRRYGEPARILLKRYGRYRAEFDDLD